jgi:hypothetical protein
MVEVLAKENIIQNAFIEHIKTIEEKEIKYLSRQLINEGKTGLFKILAEAENGNFIESISLPGDLIFSATTNQKIESLEYLFRNEYFSGRSFESESPEQAQFFDKYLNALDAARVTKDFKSLQILTDNFPKEYELDISDERNSNDDIVSKFQLYHCQVKHIEQFGFEVKTTSNMQQYPDPCLKFPIFNDLAMGAELNPLDITDLNATLNQQIEHYALLLNNASPNSEVNQPEMSNALTNNELEDNAASCITTIKNHANYFINHTKHVIYTTAKYSAYALPKMLDIGFGAILGGMKMWSNGDSYHTFLQSPISYIINMPIDNQYWIYKTTFDNIASAGHYTIPDESLTFFKSNIYNFGSYVITSWINKELIFNKEVSKEPVVKFAACLSEFLHTCSYLFYLYDQYSQYNTPYNNIEQDKLETPKLTEEQLYHPPEDL